MSLNRRAVIGAAEAVRVLSALEIKPKWIIRMRQTNLEQAAIVEAIFFCGMPVSVKRCHPASPFTS